MVAFTLLWRCSTISAEKFFNQFKNKLVGGLNTCAIASIEKFDPQLMKADVKILGTNDLILSVPVSTPQTSDYIIRVPYKKGDVVLVVFSQRDIDNIMYNADEYKHERMLSLDDAIVVNGINLYTNTLPTGHSEDLVIAKKDFTSKVILSKNGDVTIENNGNIFLGGGATEGVPLGNQLKTWLDNHTHGGGVSPDTLSPSPSQKVKTL